MPEPFATVEKLLSYSLHAGLIGREDVPFARNLLYGKLRLEPPETEDPYALPAEEVETAAAYLKTICEYAINAGLIEAEPAFHAETLSAELMGLLTARPSEIYERFLKIKASQGAEAATDWFYALCVKNNYVRMDEIKKNILFEHDHPVGRLMITINLSKPEKDSKTIAMERLAPAAGYPRCMLCVENTGYAGRVGFPARQNHRAIPLTLGGDPWHFQYSPYLYYSEHCIVFNDAHTPMRIDRGTFERMFDFVNQFPHYFIGSNAGLPIVGGSILSHEHFQGGRNTFPFPMTRAKTALSLSAPKGIVAEIISWPLSTLRLRSGDRAALIALADEILLAWREYSDETLGILAKTDAPHNAITPILRRSGQDFTLDIALRNNRADERFPDGIYHPHAELQHIKKENIGLIEVMGLFILPGRLEEELKGVREALSADEGIFEKPQWEQGGALHKHLNWVLDIKKRRGKIHAEQAESILREELTDVCARVLADCGVFADTEKGREGFLRFVSAIGLRAK